MVRDSVEAAAVNVTAGGGLLRPWASEGNGTGRREVPNSSRSSTHLSSQATIATIFGKPHVNPGLFSGADCDLLAGGFSFPVSGKLGFERVMKIPSPLQSRSNKKAVRTRGYGR